jgi:hypothetical protein
MKRRVVLAFLLLFVLGLLPNLSLAVLVNMPDGSITSTAGTYGSAYSFFDSSRWNIQASDLTMQGQILLTDINSKARWNTWDGGAGTNLGAWFMIGPYAGGGQGAWLATAQWTGSGDQANNVRWVFHPQQTQGTQPDPKYYTGPYQSVAWLNTWVDFKITVHATSATTGSAQYWIHNELISGQGQTSPPAINTFYFDITGAPNDLSNMRMISWLINGDNSSNPAYTVAWQNVTVDGAQVPIPPSMFLLASGLVGLVGLRRRFNRILTVS